MKTILLVLVALALAGASAFAATAQDAGCDASCLAARKAANPLADVRALLTDNTIAYNTGTTDDDSYNFQLQPVYSIPREGANVVLRGVIPFQGVQPGAALPPGIQGPTDNSSQVSGLGDITLQGFYSPTGGDIAYGFGLQASLPTRSDDALAGAGWGAGPAGVIFGQWGDLSWGGVAAHMWGEENFSVSILQPILIYGLGQGWYFGYNNLLSYNWNASSDNEAWTLPLGLMFGRTIVLNEEGTALDLNAGYYTVDTKPQGGPNRQFKFGISAFF